MEEKVLNPTVIFEDDNMLVLQKPAGMIVNKADTTRYETTVQDFLEDRYKIQQQEGIDKESDFYKRSGVVHRLDKETSGILLAAKTQVAFEELQKQFKERIVKKTYLALAHGSLQQVEGEIRVPVGRLPWNRKRFGVLSGGREAVTGYKVLEVRYLVNGKDEETVSLLELYPQTGRTHQIRVHLKYLNHPIVSDLLYAGRKTARNDRKKLNRLFLHAAKISFLHPISKNQVFFEAPLPKDLKLFLDSLSS